MITNHDIDHVFQALAHTTRREMLDHIRDQPGITVGQLAGHFDVSRIAVMNHLTVLERAELVLSRKDGRARKLFLNAMPLQLIYERWTDTYSAHWLDRMSLIKRAAEAAATHTAPRDDQDD